MDEFSWRIRTKIDKVMTNINRTEKEFRRLKRDYISIKSLCTEKKIDYIHHKANYVLVLKNPIDKTEQL